MLCLQVTSVASKICSAVVPLARSFGIYERPTLPWLKKRPSEHRPPSTCSVFPYQYPDKKPCLDLSTLLVERGDKCHEKLIRSFLFTHYWPREPSTVCSYMPLCSPYLAILTEKYSTQGDRWLAFEIQPRTKERKPVGVLVADKTFPWVADEYEEWAQNCALMPERHNMYFRAHCLRSPNIFSRYHVPYSYDIEVLATAGEVTGQGVALLLLRAAILSAVEQRHPIIQIVSKSDYTYVKDNNNSFVPVAGSIFPKPELVGHGICERAGMKKEWEMDYSEFIDTAGKSVFYPRRPHKSVRLYVKLFNPKESVVPEPSLYPEMFRVFKRQAIDKDKYLPEPKKKIPPVCPTCPKPGV